MSTADSEQDDLLHQLAGEFAARVRRGERPALREYTDRYPELADEIRERSAAMVRAEQVEVGRPDGDEEVTGNSPAAHPPLPRQIGDYRIIREIGRGGMGVVYEGPVRSAPRSATGGGLGAIR